MSQFEQGLIAEVEARLSELEGERALLRHVLDTLKGERPLRVVAPEAPYGLKADGTPRKRRPMTPEMQAKALQTRRANRQRKINRSVTSETLRLNVTTQAPLNRDEARAVRDGERTLAGSS